jgi:hypothetical protein
MVSLIRFGSVTHGTNMTQRFLPLSFSAGSGSLTITAPENAKFSSPQKASKRSVLSSCDPVKKDHIILTFFVNGIRFPKLSNH